MNHENGGIPIELGKVGSSGEPGERTKGDTFCPVRNYRGEEVLRVWRVFEGRS